MAIIPPALSPINQVMENLIPDRYVVTLQENLVRSGLYVKASELITLVLLAGVLWVLYGTKGITLMRRCSNFYFIFSVGY